MLKIKGSGDGNRKTTNNIPFGGLTANLITDLERLIGTEFKPNELVYLLPESLKKETEESPLGIWSIEVLPERDPEEGPFLIPLSLLVLSPKSKIRIREEKAIIEAKED
ncbi:MAG: hypothetical protein WCJ57_01800 [Candidatus Falkowbacteria bacterium]